MASQQLGTWTLGRARDHAKTRLKQYTSKSLSPTDWRDIFNYCIDEAHELLGLKNAPEYRDRASLTGLMTGVSPFVTSVDLASLSAFKLIDHITSIVDDTNPPYTKVETEEVFWNIVGGRNSSGTYYNYAFREMHIFVHAGEVLYIGQGNPAVTLGSNVTLYYQRLPKQVSAAADILDIKNSNFKQVLDMVLLVALHTLREPIPSDLKSAESKLAELREQTTKERETINKSLPGA